MAGSAGAGKTHLLKQLGQVNQEKGLITIGDQTFPLLNPDRYIETQGLKLGPAAVKTDNEALELSKTRKSFFWDTTASNPDKIKQLIGNGYDVYMIMVYTHPMISYISNFNREERNVPGDVVFDTWVKVYSQIENYRDMLDGNLSVFSNLRQGSYDQQIKAFNSAAKKGPQSLTKFLDDYNEEHSVGVSSMRDPIELVPEKEKVFKVAEKLLIEKDPEYDPQNYSQERAAMKTVRDSKDVNLQNPKDLQRLVKKMGTAVRTSRKQAVTRKEKQTTNFHKVKEMLDNENFREVMNAETEAQIRSKLNHFLK